MILTLCFLNFKFTKLPKDYNKLEIILEYLINYYNSPMGGRKIPAGK